jgi:hypothetical protein
MPRTGRPKTFRTRTPLAVYLDADEYRRLEAQAAKAGLTLSAYCRKRLLGRERRTKGGVRP